MAAPTIIQPVFPSGTYVPHGSPLLWVTAAGVLAFVNDTTPLPVTATAGTNTYPVPPAVSTYSPTRFANLGANATLNVKATPGNVFSLTCHNENAAERYLQLHDSATVSSGAPLFSFLVPTLAQIIVGTDFFTQAGAHFPTGIAFGFSTTKETYTAGTATDHSTWILFK
jgi:hypothetical protein